MFFTQDNDKQLNEVLKNSEKRGLETDIKSCASAVTGKKIKENKYYYDFAIISYDWLILYIECCFPSSLKPTLFI